MGVTGERAAEGPIEEYFLLEQLRQLIKETIEALESAPSEWSVFVSYRRDDSDYVADEICRRLQDRFGRRTILKTPMPFQSESVSGIFRTNAK